MAEKTADLRRVNEDLSRLSSLDSLTGLANRRVFDETLKVECARLQRIGSAVSLVILDVDHFKALNDSEGHQRGDEYLKLVGSELRRLAKRQIDLAARYGGEEFAVILPETDAAGASAGCGVDAVGNRWSPVAASYIAGFPAPDDQRGRRDSNPGVA